MSHSEEFFEVRRPRKSYDRQFKEKVVRHILNGECLVEELMDIYDIRSRATIKSWLSDYLKNTEKGKNS